MKKKLLTLILLLVTVFGVFAVGNFKKVEAYNVTANVYIYFQKPDSWDKAVTQLMIGHSNYSEGHKMTQIAGTDIYYVKMPSWGGYYDIAFFNTDSVWGGEGSKITNRQAYAPHYSSMINPNKNITNSWFFTVDSSNKTVTKFSNVAYTNMNVTVEAKASVGGSAVISGNKLNTQTTTTAVSGTSVSVMQYTEITLTATPSKGYKFVGWYSDAAYTNLVSSNATCEIEDAAKATYYAKFEPSVLLADMFDEYYNSGVYTKETIININTANEELELDLIKHFHAATNSLDRVQTKKTTYYSGDILWFADGHGYGKSEDNKLTSIKVENNDPTKVTVRSTTASLPGMEDYYCTLDDFIKGSHNSKHSNNETLDLVNDWSYEVDDKGNGIYKNEQADVIDAFILFTAPTWLDTDMGNYLDYTHVTVQVVGNQLVMKLWVSSTELGGKLIADAEVVGDYAVFSQATISKGIVA